MSTADVFDDDADISKYTKSERNSIKAANKAFAKYQDLGQNLPDEVYNSETGLYLLDRWSQRFEQASEHVKKTIIE